MKDETTLGKYVGFLSNVCRRPESQISETLKMLERHVTVNVKDAEAKQCK